MDGLIRRMQREFLDGLSRAYANDTAQVLADLPRDLPRLAALLHDLAAASGLKLNTHTCVIQPLGDRTPEDTTTWLHTVHSPWAMCKITHCAKYLGFQVGPTKGIHSWTAPELKAQLRVGTWPWASLGLHYAAWAYNALVFSAFQFVAQLEAVPQEILRVEEALLRKGAPGPENWCRPGGLWHLRTHYGCPAGFRSLALTGLAALARVAKFENRLQGGLRTEARSQQLWHWRCTSRFQARVDRWDEWYCSTPVTILTDAWSTLAHKGITHTKIELRAAGGAPRPWTRETMDRMRGAYQKTTISLLMDQDP